MFKEMFAEINNIYVKINNKFENSKFLNTSLKIINWLIWSFFFTGIFICRIYFSSEDTQKTEIDFFFVIIFIVVFLIFVFIRWLIFTRVKAILTRSFSMYFVWMIGENINLYGIFFEQYLDLLFGLSIGLMLVFAPLYMSDKTRQVKLQCTR